MTVYAGPYGEPIEIAPGRGDLRYTSGYNSIRRDSGLMSRIGQAPVSYAELFASQPWVAAAVMRMQTWAVRVPLKCYRRIGPDGDEREQVQPDQHPLARMLKRPWLGPRANQSALVQALLGPLQVHGNTVLEITTEGGEEWLQPLDWRMVTPLGPDSGLEIRGWRFDPDGGEAARDIPVQRSVHVAWWSPLGPLGVSPLEQLGVTLKIEDAAQRYQQSLFQFGARPPSAITSTEEFLTLEKADRTVLMDQLREDVNELYSGPENAGKPALLPPGLDWQPVGHSAVEAELIQQREVAREEVAAVYQIPPPMMGVNANTAFANIEAQKEMAYTMALGPPLVLIEQILTSSLARDRFNEDDLYVEFDFGPVLRGDRLSEITAFREGIATGLYTVNEARRAFNMPKVPSKLADMVFLPANNLQPLEGDTWPTTATGPAPVPEPEQRDQAGEGQEVLERIPRELALERLENREIDGETVAAFRFRR